MTLQTLLNDEQKAFEEEHPCLNRKAREDLKSLKMYLPEEIGCGCENCNLRDERNVHDQKIITAVIGMIDKLEIEKPRSGNENEVTIHEVKKEWLRETKEVIKSELQQALKKDIV